MSMELFSNNNSQFLPDVTKWGNKSAFKVGAFKNFIWHQCSIERLATFVGFLDERISDRNPLHYSVHQISYDMSDRKIDALLFFHIP